MSECCGVPCPYKFCPNCGLDMRLDNFLATLELPDNKGYQIISISDQGDNAASFFEIELGSSRCGKEIYGPEERLKNTLCCFLHSSNFGSGIRFNAGWYDDESKEEVDFSLDISRHKDGIVRFIVEKGNAVLVDESIKRNAEIRSEI